MERKMYKTKLCLLYQRKGHCSRQTCSFAHGDAELRRFSSSSFNGRREHKGSDLRDKLDRRHSPQRRYSPGRDARGRNAFHGHNHSYYDRGYTSRSPGKRSERHHRMKQHLDGQGDVSESLKISGGAEAVHGASNHLVEQLTQVQLDIDKLEDEKGQLEVYVEERIQEADILASRNEELEAQLSKEQQYCKRITSKIKKFIKAHSRYTRAQEELKRSQARLQKLGEQIASDASRPSANEEDSSVNIVSDGEPNYDNASLRNELQNHTSPSKKRQRTSQGVSEEAKLVNSKKSMVGATRLDKHTGWDGPSIPSENNLKEADAVNKIMVGRNGHRSLEMENKSKWRKNGPPSIASVDKAKGLEAGHTLPSTSMAAHAVDEFVESTEMEEKIEVVRATTNAFHKKGAPQENAGFLHLPPPPPPPRRDVYRQYKGEDEDVDIVALDGKKTSDTDLNFEVEVDID